MSTEAMTNWRSIFGHDEPYDEQIDGIETAIDTADSGGYTVIEGACGTGKTMIALTAGIDRVRDPNSPYERVFVLTSVKQQLRQFETDLERINEHLPDEWDPVSGLTLVGKSDVCPYNREGAGGITDENVYDRCETLRERTRGLSGEGGSTTAATLTSQARSHQVGLADSGFPTGSSGNEGGGVSERDDHQPHSPRATHTRGRFLETAGETSPYSRSIPAYDDGGPAGSEVEFCPFYAQYLEDLPDEGSEGDALEAVPFDVTSTGLLTTEDLVSHSVRHGTCPHSVMGAVLSHVEVVIGNYYHAFDPLTTAAFTGALLDESTFLVCDEAHMLEPRVRDLVSDGVTETTLRDGETELSRVLQPVRFAQDGRETQGGSKTADADLVRGELQETDVSIEELERTLEFIQDLRGELDRRIRAHLERTHPGWQSDLTALDDAEIPLRDPTEPTPDAISTWATERGYSDAIWVRAEAVGAVVERILNEAEDEEKTRALPAIGRLLGAWYRRDHTTNFREIELERTWDEMEPADSWRRAYTARMTVHNCVPSDAIGSRLAAFGGGILMSATLEPMDAFTEVTGLEYLASEEDRPVVERRYGLHFPAENRESFAVSLPKFTYGNRGSPGEETETRRLYADALESVAGLPGNVLVGMPSYGEAEWAADVLEERLEGEKPVLLDTSSSDGETQSLKDEFFAGEGKVLVTSLRGTLTEGVDYSGDRLTAAAICGVPIVNTASPRTKAVRRAYDDAFGDGFRYALTVPAVRKARQAIGRVIRGPEDVGVRLLLDERYARESWDSVRDLLPNSDAFQPVSPDMLEYGLERFRRRCEISDSV